MDFDPSDLVLTPIRDDLWGSLVWVIVCGLLVYVLWKRENPRS